MSCFAQVAALVAVCLPQSNSRAGDSDEQFWSFRPVKGVTPPAVRLEVWPNTKIDRFILAQLEARGLNPAQAADRRTLIRRATFDLIGLPPTPEEINAFLADDSPDPFSKVVERLLASPLYGERWGRHWLDVVRYADARDLIQLPAESDFREAWRYRDWVVAAFNRDMPYDQFIQQQIAGDLLQPDDPKQIDAEALVATGMLAIADFVPGDVDKEQMIADYVNDQIDVVGRAFLGLTLACARCHDHKFDPITTADYYSMAGIFFSTRLIPGPVKGNTPLVRIPLLPPQEIAAIEGEYALGKLRIAELTREINSLGEREYREWLQQTAVSRTSRYLLGAWEYLQLSANESAPSTSDFAKGRELDGKALTRWVETLRGGQVHPALREIAVTTDVLKAQEFAANLETKLSAAADQRRQLAERDPTAKLLMDSAMIRLVGDDRIAANEAKRATAWPNRGRGAAEATPVPNVEPPEQAPVMIANQSRTLLHFSGKELLELPGKVPATGTLIVAFRPDPSGPAGQRLIGWEDAAVGQHGLGVMSDGTGALQIIVRRNGASGDVVVPALADVDVRASIQVLAIVWGPGGVVVFRNGEKIGANPAIEDLSADPAITALRIGGPGSGESPKFHGDLAELRVFDAPLDEAARVRVENEVIKRWRTGDTDPAITQNEIVADLYDDLISASSPFRLEGDERIRALPSDLNQRAAQMRLELEELKKKPAPEIPRAVAVLEGGPPETQHAGFHDAKIFLRGNYKKTGETVPRGVPRVIAGASPPIVRDGSGRKELARWIADRRNPLTARVLVNRVWQHHFGVGIVSTSANFGTMGDRPSHPELLDDLANQFVESGWSIKALHKVIMSSKAYQQSSSTNPAGLAADPENRLLWRANRRRLESEALRDSLLALAGRLETKPGGPGFQDVAAPRRSLYLMSIRTGAKSAEFGPLFDAPDCSGIVERRTESIVAPQALFFLNDPLVTDLATKLAERIARDIPAEMVRERMARLYEMALGRLPSEAEFEIGLQFLSEKPNAVTTTDNWARYCRLIVSTNEFMYLD